MFIEMIDVDTNSLALVNPENICYITKIGAVYKVVMHGSYVTISDADFERLCSTVGYAVGNGSEPAKSNGLHEQTLAALMGLWNEFKAIDDYLAHGEFAISNNAVTRITRHIMNARSIMSDWQKPGDFQVPPHDQNPTDGGDDHA